MKKKEKKGYLPQLCLGVLGAAVIGVGWGMRGHPISFPIINGDGPTSVFIAGKLSSGLCSIIMLFGLLLFWTALIWALRKRAEWKRTIK